MRVPVTASRSLIGIADDEGYALFGADFAPIACNKDQANNYADPASHVALTFYWDRMLYLMGEKVHGPSRVWERHRKSHDRGLT